MTRSPQAENAVEYDPPASKSRDFLSHSRSAFVLFWLPIIAIAITATPAVSSVWRTAIWTGALTVLGTACLANAARCGRIHCYLTGPFFLIMAIVTLLYSLGVVPLGDNGWSRIGLTILIGGIALCCLPEMLFGKYRKGRIGARPQ